MARGSKSAGRERRPAGQSTGGTGGTNGKVRFALVGAGHIAQAAVLPAFQNARTSCVLTALFSGDRRKRAALAKEYNVNAAYEYEAFEEMCRADLFDAVYIALPNDLHRDYAVIAADAGVHVLCEKPMALSTSDCEEMTAAAANAGVQLMIAYRLHFERANMKAVELVRSGKIGRPRLFSSVFSMQVRAGNIRTQAEHGGGPLWDIGIYSINAARYIFGSEPTEVLSIGTPGAAAHLREVDEATAALLRFPDGCLATIQCSFGAADAGYYHVIGTKGDLRVDPAFEYQEALVHHLTIDGKRRVTTYPKRDQFAPELIYFSECIRKGERPEPGGAEGTNDVRIIEAILHSARTGAAVRLGKPEPDPRPSLRQERRRPSVGRSLMVEVEPAHA